jgi:hypothetical protein
VNSYIFLLILRMRSPLRKLLATVSVSQVWKQTDGATGGMAWRDERPTRAEERCRACAPVPVPVPVPVAVNPGGTKQRLGDTILEGICLEKRKKVEAKCLFGSPCTHAFGSLLPRPTTHSRLPRLRPCRALCFSPCSALCSHPAMDLSD